MKTSPVFPYIHLGAIHWYLVKLPDNQKANGNKSVCNFIHDLQDGLEILGFQVALRAGQKLWNIADKLEKQDDGTIVDKATSSEIRDKAKKLELTLLAEAEGIYVYIVSEKRIELEKLLKKPQTLLSKNIWRSLPVVSAKDWVEGCKSIAFELPTGAAFYLLRCVEGALKHFYLCVVKRNRLPKNKCMWGPMIKALRDRKRNKPPEELLDTLDRIRINFRNPTSHPEKMYDIEEVQDLFGLCVDALNRIVKTKYWETPEDSLEKLIKEHKKNK